MLSRPASGETCSARYNDALGQRGVPPNQSRQSPVTFTRSRIADPFRRLRAHHVPSTGSCRYLIGGGSIGRERRRRRARTRARSTPASPTRPRSSTARSRAAVEGPRARPGPRPRRPRPRRARGWAAFGEPSRSGGGAGLVGEQLAQAAGRDVKADPVAPGAVQLDALFLAESISERRYTRPNSGRPERERAGEAIALDISRRSTAFWRRNAPQGGARIGR